MTKKDAIQLKRFSDAIRDCGMRKADALSLLNCENDLALSKALKVSHTTVGRWEDPLPPYAVIRVVDSLPLAPG